MKPKLYFFLACGGLAVPLCGQEISRAEAEELFRYVMSDTHAIHITVTDDGRVERQDPERPQLMKIAERANMPRTEVLSLFLELAQEGIKTYLNRSEPSDTPGLMLAANSLSAVGSIADMTMLDRLVDLLQKVPEQLEITVAGAALDIAYREAPEELPAVARRLTQGGAYSPVYGHLHDVLKYKLPGNQTDRERRTALITGIFKEGIRDPTKRNRIYLDHVLEEFDPVFRQSDERRRILTELTRSANPIVKRYAEDKLREVFDVSIPQAGTGEATAATATAQPPAEVATVPAKEIETESGPVTPTQSNRIPVYAFLFAGLLLLCGVGYWYWRKR